MNTSDKMSALDDIKRSHP